MGGDPFWLASLAESNGSLPRGVWLSHACLYTGISSGPNARKRVWENLVLFDRHSLYRGNWTGSREIYDFIVYIIIGLLLDVLLWILVPRFDITKISHLFIVDHYL